MKLLFGILLTVLCVAIAAIVPTTMYFVWGMIAPASVVEKLATLALFWFGGGGLAIFLGVLSFLIWVSGLKALSETRF